jgi:hypothetical protein
MGPHDMHRRRLAVVVLTALAALPLGGCAWWQWTLAGVGGVTALSASRFNHLYAGQHQEAGLAPFEDTAGDVRLAFVESDDHGWFHDPGQAAAVLDELDSLAANGNVAVVVYVHGWRHNAARKDTDVEAFKQTLGYLGERLNRDDFRRLRADRTGDPNTTIVGIYVGWRGKIVPELPVPLAYVNLPVFFSFWNRKDAAHVVGRGDLREFLLHLDDLYARVNRRGETDVPEVTRLMSLVIIGHSFGGHIVFDATRDRLESHLFGAMDACAEEARSLSERLYPARAAERPLDCQDLVQGFGDLVVLINPAIEADAYRRIDDIVQAAHFNDDQQPLLVTVSAEDDGARNRQFATARGISLWGTKRTPAQSKLLGHALGSYGPQVTHRLALRDSLPETKERARRRILEERRDGGHAAAGAMPVLLAAIGPVQVDPNRLQLVPEDAELVRLREIDPRHRTKPAIVIRASKDVIRGHSDFFRVGFVSWLSYYVLSIQRNNLELEPSRRRLAK